MYLASTRGSYEPMQRGNAPVLPATEKINGIRCKRGTSSVDATELPATSSPTYTRNVSSVIDTLKESNTYTARLLIVSSGDELKKLVNELNEIERLVALIYRTSSYLSLSPYTPYAIEKILTLTPEELTEVARLRRQRRELLSFEPNNSTEYSANQKDRLAVTHRLYELTGYYPYKPR